MVVATVLACSAGAAAIGATIVATEHAPISPTQGSQFVTDENVTSMDNATVRAGLYRYTLRTTSVEPVEMIADVIGRGGEPLRIMPQGDALQAVMPRPKNGETKTVHFTVPPENGQLVIKVLSTRTSDQLLTMQAADTPFQLGVATA